jgi:hypothetical protein
MNLLKMAIYMSRNISWLKEYENKYILSIVANEGFIYRLMIKIIISNCFYLHGYN